MIIRNNLSSINTINALGNSTKNLKKVIEKLSSGYRINCAADDAAGLAISEKMRGQIRGLQQASRNAQDGISLIQTAEGGLDEVHSILQRINELSVQAANGTYNKEDIKMIQEEIDQHIEEIDRISHNTEFNGIKLLDGNLSEKFSTNTASTIFGESGSMTLQDLLNSPSNNLNLIFYDQTNDFQTVQSTMGTATISGYEYLKNALKTQIVPRAVTGVLSAFSPALNYLTSSSIGIGLNLYSSTTSTTLASVTLGYGLNGPNTALCYKLSVNMASLAYDAGGNLTEASRSALETTIVHEMVHALMDESLTNGMIGITNGVVDSDNAFPAWFTEGMAQTGAGGYANCNDWINGGLGITTSTSKASISSIVTGSNSLASGTTASKYATGYLACMYLGYLASGSSNVTAGSISSGIGKVLSDLIGGKSLETVIKERTGGKYTSVADFQSKFGDSDSSDFIYRLTQVVGNTGNGSLVTGNLLDNDLLPNTSIATSLFELDTTNDIVKNIYPSDVNVLSGGGKSNPGTAPVGGYDSTIGGGGTGPVVVNPGSTIDLSNIAPVAGISFNSALNVLTITDSGDYTLTGVNTTGVRVVVKSGVNAKVTLDNAKINTGFGAGISLEGNANVALNLVGDNTVKTSKQGAAGIRVTTGATLRIQGNGTLDAESTLYKFGLIGNGAGIGGGVNEDAGNIIIDGGTIKSSGSTGIGGGENGDGGSISITGGTVTASGNSGAGIGGGTWGNGGNILITGGNVNAASSSGAGIGGGAAGKSGVITITGGIISAQSKPSGAASSGAGIGGGGSISGNNGDCETIIISGGTITAKAADGGAGIGGGYYGNGGNITITGGTITAEGGSHVLDNGISVGGAGIGGGFNKAAGTVNINGESVIIKATGGGYANNIGGGAPNTGYGGTPVSGGTVNRTTGIVFEGNSGGVYGNVTLGGSLDCDGKTLTAQGGSVLNVLTAGRIINHGTFTNSGRIENHGVIGDVSGTGITHHYVSAVAKNIKEPDTAITGQSLASSITALSPSTITVTYNGTNRTLTGAWSVTDMDGKAINDPAGTIAGENDQYKYNVTFTSEDNIYFDPANMTLYESQKSGTEETITNDYISALGPGGGGGILIYSYVVGSRSGAVVPPIVVPPVVGPPADGPSATNQGGYKVTNIVRKSVEIVKSGGLKIHMGANPNQYLIISIESIKSKDLGLNGLSVLTHDNADKAIGTCSQAINKVSHIRSRLGAYQNSLEHAINNLDNTAENLQCAESRIRDFDMAKGMTEFLKYQLLQQTGQNMLAQANQSTKNVLALVSGQ